ncbi:MAG: efflux RND transporter permease subunit [bacterium]
MISDFAINHRITVYVMIVVIVAIGLDSYISLPRESAPDITIPYVFITTPYEGVAPSDIESLITIPIERKLKSLTDLEEIRSNSAEGMSTISVEFTPDIDIDTALQKVRDKVDQAKADLPDDLEDDPQIEEVNFSEFPILTIVITGPAGLVRLKDIADDLEDEIEAVPGVLNATVIGGLEREIRVEYDPERLAAVRLSVTDVAAAVQANNVTTPGGNLDIGEGNYILKIPGEFDNPEEARNLVVYSRDNRPIYIGDVANLVDGYEDRRSISRLNGRDSITITVQKRSGENIIRIADEVKKLLESTAPTLPAGTEISITLDSSKDIDMMVSDLENNILSGLILVLVVVFFAMGIRNATLVSMAIPLSMLITFFVLWAIGITLNMVVLFSLILAVGMLVDNAIVIVENIYRHHQEGKDRVDASKEGTREVAWPVTTSTMTTVAAFFPMMFWPGIMGEFMSFLPKTVMIALLSSLFVAMIVNPALAASFIKGNHQNKNARRGLVLRGYRRLLGLAVDNPGVTLFFAVSLLAVVVGLYVRKGHGVELFPASEPRRGYVLLTCPEGTTLDVSDAFVKRVELDAEGYSDVEYTVANVGANAGGSGFFGGGGESTNRGRVSLEFLDMEDRSRKSSEIIAELRKRLSNLVGVDVEVKKEEEGPPTGAAVCVEISGEKYEVLEPLCRQIKDRIRGIPGLVNLRDDYLVGRPEFRVVVDKERAALFGLNTTLIAMNVKAVARGIKVGVYREGNDEYDIIARLPKHRREDLGALMNLMISRPGGDPVPLSSVAKIQLSSGLGAIDRVDQKRVITVEADAEGRLANDVLNDVRATVAGMDLPRGYSVSFRGQNEEQDKANAFLTRAFFSALFLIALILVTEFNSLSRPLVVLSSVVLSMMGVFVGLLITAKPFGIIMTGIGVISLAGVVVNNAIVLVDYVLQLRERGKDERESLLEAGQIRFRPVMLTAITTILGLLPMAIGVSFDFRELRWDIGSESSQWWGPMAVAVIFGLTVATVLTLVVVPSMISWFDKAGALMRRIFRMRNKPNAECGVQSTE